MTDFEALNTAYNEAMRTYTSVPCPYCHQAVYGCQDDIDSALRKHIDFCPEAQNAIEWEAQQDFYAHGGES